MTDIDDLSFFEIAAVLESYNEQYQERWEQVRNIMYMTALVNSTKRITPQEVLRFPWDKDNRKEKIDMVEFNKSKEAMLKGILKNDIKRTATVADFN